MPSSVRRRARIEEMGFRRASAGYGAPGPFVSRKLRKGRAVNLLGVRVHRFQALDETGLFARVGSRQDAVDIDLHARFDGAGTEIVVGIRRSMKASRVFI